MKRIRKMLAILTLGFAMMMPNTAKAASSNVERLDGRTRVETSIAVSKKAYADGTATDVVLAGYHGEADALTGTLLASSKDAPLLLIHKFDSAMKAEFKRLGVQTVHLLGGESVLSKSLEQEIKKEGYNVKRVAGSGRFETAVEVANASAGNNEHAFLTNDGRSGSLADALAVGPVSGRDKNPILLTSKNKLPDSTLEAMKKMGTKNVTIIGGPGAVGTNVENALQSANIRVDRIAGDERWDTARRIANRYFKDSKDAIVTNDGRVSFADALMGGYLGAKKNIPILLTQAHQINSQTSSIVINNMKNIFILGGPSVVQDKVSNNINSILTGEGLGDVEPNNTFNTASLLKINSTIDGTLPPQDEDYFKVSVPAEGTFTMNLLSKDKESLEIHLYDDAHNRITWWHDPEVVSLTSGLKPGEYYIKVNPRRSRYDETLSYQLKTSFTPSKNSDEGAGNKFTNAKKIELDETIQGTIGYGTSNQNKDDYFKIEVPKEGEMRVNLLSIDADGLNLAIYDEDYNRISRTLNREVITLTNGLKPGSYYIYVESPSGSNYGSYQLETTFTSSENTDEGAGDKFTNAKKIELDETIQGTIGYGANNQNKDDYFKIEIPTDGKLRMNLLSKDIGSLDLYLYDKNYERVSRITNREVINLTTELKSGSYYIHVKVTSGYNYGSYQLETIFQ